MQAGLYLKRKGLPHLSLYSAS
uniref:Uncharacterized protein n=1 Tax=Rhizophora mucronata TaxID=61149 RepID=A0A2P2JZS4_RHIMU